MGTLRSLTIAPQGYTYNGVLLGEPVEIDNDPATFEWDDSAFPSGSCEVVDGELVVTPDEAGVGGELIDGLVIANEETIQ